MSAVADLDKNPFENLCKGVYDFNDEELTQLHEIAGQVKAILQSASDRQRKRMTARNQFKQMG